MVLGISQSAVNVNNTQYKSKKQQVMSFLYNSSDSNNTYENEQSSINNSINVNEEYEKSVFESVGVRAALSINPTYSVTKDQVEYLSQKYDLDKIPQNSTQERDFLNDLVSMNIIGEKDAKLFNFNCGGSIESVSSYVSVIPFDENNTSAYSIPLWEEHYDNSDNIIDRLMSVIDTQKNITAYYKNKCIDIDNALKCDLDGLTASQEFLYVKQKLLSVLQNISEIE